MITPPSRAAALLAAALLAIPAQSQPPLPPPEKAEPQPEPGVQVLDRGPIHEAFAQPGADVRGKDVTAPKAPPPPIPELPPEAKPDGDNVKWVPGYWMWDADRNDFIWVSGFWRNAPVGREWSPGKWAAGKDGKFAYTPGFWRPTDMNSWRIDLPEPPATVEAGPNTPSDNPDAHWIPGAWEFRGEKYVWRPGYWAKPYGELLWTPPQYLATTHGFAHVPGYWDYPLEDRGLLYAPVCFTQPLWATPGWAYRPRFAVGLGFGNGWGAGGFFTSLYIGPGFNNYYFGNFGRPWAGGTWLGLGNPLWSPVFGFGGPVLGLNNYAGFIPWWAPTRGFANPLWRHYCWLNRNDPHYPKGVAGAYVGKALGVANPGVPAPRAVAAQPAAVGGALNTAVRAAATNAARPAVPPKQTPLVQPAPQVARAITEAKAARAANPAVIAAGKPAVNSGPAVGAATKPGPNPATVTANRLSVQPPAAPTHSGAKVNPPAAVARTEPKMPAVVPGIQRPATPDVRNSQDRTPNSGLQPLIRPGGTPGITAAPKSVTPVGPSNPLPSPKGNAGRPPVAVGNPAPVVNPSPPVIRSNPLPVGGGNPAPRISLPPPQAAPIQRLPATPSLPSMRPPVGGGGGGRVGPVGLPGGGGGGRGPAALPGGGGARGGGGKGKG